MDRCRQTTAREARFARWFGLPLATVVGTRSRSEAIVLMRRALEKLKP